MNEGPAGTDERFRLALDLSAVPMAFTAPDGRFLRVNPAMTRLLGRSEADVLTCTWQELTHPEDLSADQALLAEVLAGDRDDYRLLKRYLRPDGSVVWGDLAVSCVRGADGAVDYAIAQIVDVTDREAALAERERSERMLRTLMKSAPVAMGVVTPDGAFVRANQALADFFGRPLEEIYALRWQDLSDGDAVPHEEEFIGQLLAGARDSYRLVKSFTRPDGSVQWGLLSVACTRLPDGTPASLIGQIVDITEHKRSHETLRATLASMLDPHVLFAPVRDDRGRIVDLVYESANPAACGYLRRTEQELVGARVGEIFAGDAVARIIGWCTLALAQAEPLVIDETQIASAVVAEARWFDVRAVRVDDRVSFTWRDVSERHRAAEDLARREYRYRLLADNATDVIVRTGSNSTIEWVSPSVRTILGWAVEDLLGRRVSDFMHPDDLAGLRRIRRGITAGGGTEGRVSARFRTADGGWRWMSDHGRAILDSGGRVMGGIDTLRDIQAEHEAREAVEQRERELRGVIDTLVDPWVRLDAVRDPSGRIVDFAYVDANDAACDFNRVPRGELIGLRLLDLLPEHRTRGVFDDYARVVETGEPLIHDDAPFTGPDGLERRYDNRAVKVGDGISLMWRDVTERFEARQLLRRQAEHDLLTGVANRLQLARRMDELLARSPRQGTRTAVLFCDLDHFKAINDAFGHAAGDVVLKSVAGAMRAALRDDDLVARLGGDEFVVILESIRDEQDAVDVAGKVAAAVQTPVSLAGQSVVPHASIGVAVVLPGESGEVVLSRADRALYAAKAAGRDRVVLAEAPA